MLDLYKQAYASKNIQFILSDYKGVILETDQKFLELSPGEALLNIHPFFYCIAAIIDAPEDVFTYNCVHLTINKTDFITDIAISKKKEGIFIVIHNLTDHYISYQAIAQSRNESIIRSELVVLKNLELEEREKFKNRFIQNFSHELRNPLTSIISITNILGATQLTAEQKKMIHFLKDSNSNLRLMLEDILSISMIASGKLSLQNKIFSLSRLIELLEFTYRSKARQLGLEFVLNHDEKVPETVEGDRLRLYQVLTNLLDNAFKYTEQGTISLDIQLNQKRANKASLRFRVSDTGIGIPKESVTRVFESFEQLNTVKKEHGTGLGLSIVKGLLELMDSKIVLQSNLGEGSVFYFDIVLRFPLHPIPAVPPKDGGRKIGNTIAGKNVKKYKLLVVEDDERVQTVLFKSLMDTDRFYIDVVNDGAQVMEEVINNSYDLILMDINLPNVSGDQITKLIRDFPFNNIKNIPIIGITAHAYADDVNAYLHAGMNAVLSKPFENEELHKTLFSFLK